MDFWDRFIGYGVMIFVLYGVVRYLYASYKEGAIWKGLRNLAIFILVITFFVLNAQYNWIGDSSPCASYDTRGCNE